MQVRSINLYHKSYTFTLTYLQKLEGFLAKVITKRDIFSNKNDINYLENHRVLRKSLIPLRLLSQNILRQNIFCLHHSMRQKVNVILNFNILYISNYISNQQF